MNFLVNEYLQDEADIVWLVKPSEIPYVREENWETTRPSQEPPKSTPEWQVVGYSTVKDNLKRERGQNYRRRLFTLRPHDRVNEPNGTYRTGYPAEAVDPMSVKAGMPSRKTQL